MPGERPSWLLFVQLLFRPSGQFSGSVPAFGANIASVETAIKGGDVLSDVCVRNGPENSQLDIFINIWSGTK